MFSATSTTDKEVHNSKHLSVFPEQPNKIEQVPNSHGL